MEISTTEQKIAALNKWHQEGLCEETGAWMDAGNSGSTWSGQGHGYQWEYRTMQDEILPDSIKITKTG